MSALQILHYDLSGSLATAVCERQECLIVFWWKDCPVGQAYDRGDRGRGINAQDLANQCVDPETLQAAKQICERERAKSAADGLLATVVVCTRNRPDELTRCLSSLTHQTRVPESVVVVDNGSSDERTREVALAAGAVYVRELRAGLDFARNAGAMAATGDIILYTDDDVRMHPRWMQRMVAAFRDPGVMAVTGLLLPAELETTAQIHFERFWSFGRGYRSIYYRRPMTEAWKIGAGASMAFRRQAFNEAGLFDERLDVGQAGCSGDSEYWHRLLSRGWACRYEPSAVAFHHHRREMNRLADQIYFYMRGHAAALLVQFERSRDWRSLFRAIFFMPCWYAWRAVGGILRGWRERDLLFRHEVRGYVSGIHFYLRTLRR